MSKDKEQLENIERDDYVVALLNDKPCLVKVLAIKGESLSGNHEYRDREDKVEFFLSDVRANLGPKPQMGTVYGAKTERLLGVTDTKAVKQVEWYFPATDDQVEEVHDGIMAGAKLLRKHDLHRILKVVKVRVVWNMARKLTAKSIIGTYTAKGIVSDDNPDVIMIKYHKDAVDQLPRLLIHEAAHGIYWRLMSTNRRADWIFKFFEQAEITKMEPDITDSALKNCVKDRSVILLDPDEQLALNAVLARVEQTCGIRTKDMLVLLQANTSYAKRILGAWRDYPVTEGGWETHVSEYADINPDEFFAEALANYCTGMSIPEYLKELLDETLEEVAGRDVAMGDD